MRDAMVKAYGSDGVRGLLYGDASQFFMQLIDASVVAVFGFCMAYVWFKLSDLITPIRVDRRDRDRGSRHSGDGRTRLPGSRRHDPQQPSRRVVHSFESRLRMNEAGPRKRPRLVSFVAKGSPASSCGTAHPRGMQRPSALMKASRNFEFTGILSAAPGPIPWHRSCCFPIARIRPRLARTTTREEA